MSGPVTYTADGYTVVFYPVIVTTFTSDFISQKVTASVADPNASPTTTTTVVPAALLHTSVNSLGITSIYTATASRTKSLVANENQAMSTSTTSILSIQTVYISSSNGRAAYTEYFVNGSSYTGGGTSSVATPVTTTGIAGTTITLSFLDPVSTGMNGTQSGGDPSHNNPNQMSAPLKITIGVCSAALVIILSGLTFWFFRWKKRKQQRRRSGEILTEKDDNNNNDNTRSIRPVLPSYSSVDGGVGGGIGAGAGFGAGTRADISRGRSMNTSSSRPLRDPFAEGGEDNDDDDDDDELEALSPVETVRSHHRRGAQPPSRSMTTISHNPSNYTTTTIPLPEGMVSPYPVPVPVPTALPTRYNSPFQQVLQASMDASTGSLLLPPTAIGGPGQSHAPHAHGSHNRRISEITIETRAETTTDTDDDVYAVDGSSLARTLTTESRGSEDSRTTISARAGAAWGPFADSNAVGRGQGETGGSSLTGDGDEDEDDDESILARSGEGHTPPVGWATFNPPSTSNLTSATSLSGSGSGSNPLTASSGRSTNITVPSPATLVSTSRPFLPPISSSGSIDPFADSINNYTTNTVMSTLPPPRRPHSISGRSDRSTSTNAITEASFRPGDDSRVDSLPLHSRWREPPAIAIQLPIQTTRWREITRVNSNSSLASTATADTADTESRSRQTFVRHGDMGVEQQQSGMGRDQMRLYQPGLGQEEQGRGNGQEQGRRVVGDRVVHLPPTYRDVYGDGF